MTTEQRAACSICGQPVPSWSAGGLCPRCLIKGGMTPVADRRPIEPPEVEELQPLLEAYEIHSLLGHGGMGAVYHATQRALDREVALKILPINEEDDPESVERFQVEAKALARLNHPNIVSVHDFGKEGPYFYIVMELVEGSDLASAVESGRIDPSQALAITSQLCGALQYAHSQGVVHRDLKPANVFIDREGQVKVGDFGLAKVVDEGESAMLTERGDRLGTPLYMAPEQRRGDGGIDHRVDIYSMGIIFYELLTGDLPSGTFPPPSQCVEVDKRVDAVVTKSTQSDPDRRYRQASEMQSSVETIRRSPSGRKGPDRSRRGVIVPVAGLGLLAVVGLIFWAIFGPGDPAPSVSEVRSGEPISLQPDKPEAGDRAGYNLWMRGDSLLIGAPQARSDEAWGEGYLAVMRPDESGAWRETFRLRPPDGGKLGDQFGRAVADDRFVIVGAPRVDLLGWRTNCGMVYVYDAPAGSDPATWTLRQKLTAPLPTGREYFGAYLALDGDYLAVSADWNQNAQGTVHLFALEEGRWKHERSFMHPFARDVEHRVQFGYSGIAMKDGVLVVASRNGKDESLDRSGTLSIFERDEGGKDNWGLVAYLTPPQQLQNQRFGSEVIFDGNDRILAGAPFEQDESGGRGCVYVIERTGNSWEIVTRLAPPGAEANGFGHGMAVVGDRLFVGSYGSAAGANLAEKTGIVYEFGRSPEAPSRWVSRGKIEGSSPGANFGFRMVATDDYLLIGEPSKQTPRPLAGGVVLVPLSGE